MENTVPNSARVNVSPKTFYQTINLNFINYTKTLQLIKKYLLIIKVILNIKSFLFLK